MACGRQRSIDASDINPLSRTGQGRRVRLCHWLPGGTALPLLRVVVVWLERARQRSALRDLDDRALDDIGIGRPEAEREARKPFWRA